MLQSHLKLPTVESFLTDAEEKKIFKLASEFPACRRLFITIRDPKQAKWARLGKCADWIRRYSKNYYIVRGTKGGSHCHILAFTELGRELKPQKGIHFNIKQVGAAQVSYDIPSREEYLETRESKEKVIYFKIQKFEELTSEHLDPDQQNELKVRNYSIIKYFKRNQNKQKAIRKKTLIEKHVANILMYMQLNLQEPRENGEQPEMFIDFICRLSNI